MTPEQLQEYWDASLIASWRRAQKLSDAVGRWERLTGKTIEEVRDQLRRLPKRGLPWSIGVRVFVAEFLPKISERLWNQAPEKDVLLLKKLQTSTYTSLAQPMPSKNAAELVREQRAVKKNLGVVRADVDRYSDRNQSTDWGVTKASGRKARA